MTNKNWTKEETIVAFNLYCRIPFQRAYSSNPLIVEIANIIGRSPNSVKMKIGNFGSLDPELAKSGIVGLVNTSKLDREVWDEFNDDWETLAFESEKLIAQFKSLSVEDRIDDIEVKALPEGLEKQRMVRTRVNQSFFRSSVMSAYDNTCCITGIAIPEILIASHIKPWKDSNPQTERTNPKNGLCLNALHDKAFDSGLISVDEEYRIIVSQRVKELYVHSVISESFAKYDGRKMLMPQRFVPEAAFLKYHLENIFLG